MNTLYAVCELLVTRHVTTPDQWAAVSPWKPIVTSWSHDSKLNAKSMVISKSFEAVYNHPVSLLTVNGQHDVFEDRLQPYSHSTYLRPIVMSRSFGTWLTIND